MSAIKKIALGLLVLVIVGIVGCVLFANPLFRMLLRGALVELRENQGIDVTFKDASFSFSGAVGIEGISATDLSSQTQFADIGGIEADVAVATALSDPIVVNRLSVREPVLTWFPGFTALFSTPEAEAISGAELTTEGEPTPPAVETSASGRGVLIRKGEIKDGKFRYQREGEEPQVILAQMDASVEDLSNSTPFAFDLEAGLTGASKGTLGLKGKVNPTTFDSEVTLTLSGVDIPEAKPAWPKTDGNLSVVVSDNLSKILSTGKINMAAAPPTIPAEMSGGGPFEVNWRLDATVEGKGKGKIDLRSMELAVQGLKGGPQAVIGNGSYDPTSEKGSFQFEGKGISVPLANTFIEKPLQMSFLAGKADLSAKLARAGAKEPFLVDANLQLGGLNFKDLSGQRGNLKFKDIGVTTKAAYSPDRDLLKIDQLNARLDDIALAVSGTVTGVQDEKKRELDLVVKNDNLDLGRVVPLAVPEFEKETGAVSGKAAVNLSVKGQTASKKFPILEGLIDLKDVTFVPKGEPDKKVGVKGQVNLDTTTIAGKDMDLNLGGVPGKVTFKVTGYNEPKKNVTANLRGLSIDPLVNLYKPEAAGLLLGNLSGDIVTVLGGGQRPDSLEINYVIEKGKMLTKHPIPASIVNLVGWEWMKKGIVLTDARGKIVQDEKGYRLDPLLFMGDKGGIAIKGWVGFDNKLTATARVNVAKSEVDELPRHIQPLLKARDDSNFAFLDIPMGGSVNRPLPKLDLQSAVDAGLGVLQDHLKGKTGGDTEKVLEGVGNLLRGGDRERQPEGGESQDTEGGVGSLLRGLLERD
ncbi:MAG: DUF748 domain-containing protein [Candidatus Omnitrophica bacterium]|nr:DUF748 domain-containing protein [Candidatus Omnitrophota bacterium]